MAIVLLVDIYGRVGLESLINPWTKPQTTKKAVTSPRTPKEDRRFALSYRAGFAIIAGFTGQITLNWEILPRTLHALGLVMIRTGWVGVGLCASAE